MSRKTRLVALCALFCCALAAMPPTIGWSQDAEPDTAAETTEGGEDAAEEGGEEEAATDSGGSEDAYTTDADKAATAAAVFPTKSSRLTICGSVSPQQWCSSCTSALPRLRVV